MKHILYQYIRHIRFFSISSAAICWACLIHLFTASLTSRDSWQHHGNHFSSSLRASFGRDNVVSVFFGVDSGSSVHASSPSDRASKRVMWITRTMITMVNATTSHRTRTIFVSDGVLNETCPEYAYRYRDDLVSFDVWKDTAGYWMSSMAKSMTGLNSS